MGRYNSTLTKSANASKVLSFLKLPDPFICIAKPTPWSNPFDDERIPTASSTSLIEEPIVYIRPSILRPIYKSPCGSVDILGMKWNLPDDSEIRIENSVVIPPISDLYVQLRINSDQYNTDSFRIMGLYTNTLLIPSANPNLLSYEPVFIGNPGILHWIAYSTPIYRLENKTHIIDLVISL